MKQAEIQLQCEAMDEFHDAADRLIMTTTLRDLIGAYSECLRLAEKLPDYLRQHFEIDQFLVDLAVERARVLLAA